MPPNFADAPFERDPESFPVDKNQTSSTANLINQSDEDYKLKIFHSTLNILAHTLIGAVTGVSLFYSFRNGIPLGPTPLHIVLCVIGVSTAYYEHE